MTTLLTVLAVLLGLLGGFWAGFSLGGRVRGLPRRFWALNGAVVIVCMLANLTGLTLSWPYLSYGALGVMGGAFTGLKYGYSESIGVWRVVDRIAGIEPMNPAEEPETPEDPASG